MPLFGKKEKLREQQQKKRQERIEQVRGWNRETKKALDGMSATAAKNFVEHPESPLTRSAAREMLLRAKGEIN